MFHVLKGNEDEIPFNPRDNLTEIPRPKVTNQQRFFTIAESEPFGPIDAAQVLGIEPAAETLDKLTQHTPESQDGSSKGGRSGKQAVAFYGPVYEGEKHVFRFISAKAGEVGYRYGASRDDRRHGRKVQFDQAGQRKYVFE
jgi:Eukaryotic mitochondrial regulator protein